MIATQLNVKRINAASNACSAIHTSAPKGLTWPDGSGRDQVRATEASSSRSV